MRNKTATSSKVPACLIPKLLTIYTSELSQEVDGVIDCLKSLGWDILRNNLCRYPEELTITKDPLSQSPSGLHWLHSIPPFSTASTLSDLSREVSLRECYSFWEGIWLDIEPSKWLNSPASASAASNKLHQLRRARNLGIKTPNWLVTNSPEDLRKFLNTRSEAVLKSLACGFIRHPSGDVKFFTRKANNEKIDSSQCLLGPIIIQEYIPKRFEIRATVVGSEVYCSLLDYKKLPPTTDYRQLEFNSIRHAFSACPPSISANIARQSRDIAASYGLKFAGVDWIIDNDNQPYFLELNPLGSFKWFEVVGAGNITLAIAMTFESIRNEESANTSNL